MICARKGPPTGKASDAFRSAHHWQLPRTRINSGNCRTQLVNLNNGAAAARVSGPRLAPVRWPMGRAGGCRQRVRQTCMCSQVEERRVCNEQQAEGMAGSLYRAGCCRRGRSCVAGFAWEVARGGYRCRAWQGQLPNTPTAPRHTLGPCGNVPYPNGAVGVGRMQVGAFSAPPTFGKNCQRDSRRHAYTERR